MFERNLERARQLCKKRGIRMASRWTGSPLCRHTPHVGRASWRNWVRLAFAPNSR